jgi:hypothetical protein
LGKILQTTNRREIAIQVGDVLLIVNFLLPLVLIDLPTDIMNIYSVLDSSDVEDEVVKKNVNKRKEEPTSAASNENKKPQNLKPPKPQQQSKQRG